ncbi:hypothetical protein HYPSUDRAFT_69288 [Hypholoma sublateritium FD-334 SS-4]|uniref:Uncharacterized protein n=1 Tax=Hypholoma sublateritium (strain FD-334 SS-4) TaxID=945553 RepID=A0A0D2PGY5_HYPSF|nr:hypothetical protein HYPSUDRAFT_69288 [Hypholoma sublateritium FD-334 SS-4]
MNYVYNRATVVPTAPVVRHAYERERLVKKAPDVDDCYIVFVQRAPVMHGSERYAPLVSTHFTKSASTQLNLQAEDTASIRSVCAAQSVHSSPRLTLRIVPWIYLFSGMKYQSPYVQRTFRQTYLVPDYTQLQRTPCSGHLQDDVSWGALHRENRRTSVHGL